MESFESAGAPAAINRDESHPRYTLARPTRMVGTGTGSVGTNVTRSFLGSQSSRNVSRAKRLVTSNRLYRPPAA